jgi:Xaa-Pro aminopeptidase
MVPITQNLVDQVWGPSKPPMPTNPVFVLDTKYAGRSVQEKFEQIGALVPKEADMLLTATLDEIAWFLNLRGSDIEFNPVFFSYLIFFP